MRQAVFFKLFKQDRTPAADVPAAAEAKPGAAASSEVVPAEAAPAELTAPESAGSTDGEAASAAPVSVSPAEVTPSASPADAAAAGSDGVASALRAANSNSEVEAETAASPASPVGAEAAAEAADAGAFATTADLEPLAGPIGQERALSDLARAASVSGAGFHIAVVADHDLLAGDAIRAVLAASARGADAGCDWVYVHNWDDASRPRALRLPAGHGALFAAAVHHAAREARASVVAALRSPDRVAQRRTIDAETRDALEDRLNGIKARAEAQNLAVVRTPGGYVVAPVHDGKVVKPEVFARLPEAMRADVEMRVRALQDELAATLAERPRVEAERRARLLAVDRGLAETAAAAAFAEAVASYGDDPALAAHLGALAADIAADAVARADDIVSGAPTSGGAAAALPASPSALATSASAHGLPRRLCVNVFRTAEAGPDGTAGRVVALATQVSPAALVGHARREVRDDGRPADHLDLAPGAAHRAGGGVLVVDAGRLARDADAAATLEHMLATAEIAIADAAPALSPEPVPLAARVVLVGDRTALSQLAHTTPGLLARLSATAHCDATMPRHADSELTLARRLAAAVREHGLRPLDAAAVAALVALSARMAGTPGELSCRIAPLVDVVREADVLVRAAGREMATRTDIETAAGARERALAALGAARADDGVARGGHGSRS